MKKIMIALALALTISACPKNPAPPSAPEQSTTEPAMTEEYLTDQLKNYFEGRDAIFAEARQRMDAGENGAAVHAQQSAKLAELQQKTDTAVKHIPNIGGVSLPDTFKKDLETLKSITGGGSEY